MLSVISVLRCMHMYTALLYMGCSLLYCIQNLRLDLLCCIGLYACLANIKFVSFVSKIALWPIHLHLSFPGCPPTEIILFFLYVGYIIPFFLLCVLFRCFAWPSGESIIINLRVSVSLHDTLVFYLWSSDIIKLSEN